MKFSCIIVDDEPLSHQVLKSHLARFDKIEVVGNFFNAKDAAAYLASHSADLMFLDIQMPEISGMDFLRALPFKPVTIITTAFRDYALEGFELGVIDYLLKPVDFERFTVAITRAIDFLQLVKFESAIDVVRSEDNYDLLIKSGTKRILLDYRKITFAQGLKDYTILHTEERKYVVKGSIKFFEEHLPAKDFVRVHKSFIVARHLIRVVHKNKIELESVSIPIGRHFKESIESIFKNSE